MEITRREIEQVYEKWGKKYREDPDFFMSDEETTDHSIEVFASLRTDYFLKLLEEGKNE